MMTSGKTLDYYLSLPYPILLFPPESPDTTWYAKIPLLPGCMSDGETVEEALANLREAQTVWLEVSIERGHTIQEPKPRTLGMFTMLASEEVLRGEWDTPEEDEAWVHL